VTHGALAGLAEGSRSLPEDWEGWSWSLLGAQGKLPPLSHSWNISTTWKQLQP